MKHTYPPEYCGDCQKNHGLMPENQLAWRVFMDCMPELRVGPEGVPLGIRGEAIWKRLEMERSSVEDPLDTFSKVRHGDAEYTRYISDERERAMKRHESKRKAERGFE